MENNQKYRPIDNKRVLAYNTAPLKKIRFSGVPFGNKRGCASGKCGMRGTVVIKPLEENKSEE